MIERERKEMSYHSSEILHMMEIFIMFFLLSLPNTTHIPTADALSDAEVFNVHGLQELYSMEDNLERTQTLHIEKVSGEDENEENAVSVVEKFRALLGLRSLHKRTNGDNENVSPSPSPSPFSKAEAPSPAPAPVPAPVLHIHPHSHHPHRLRSISPPHKIQRADDNGRTRKILIAVLVSAGTATLICVLGLIWGCKKYKERKKKPTRVISVYGEKRGRTSGGSKYVGSGKSASKVSLNPGTHDLIYLDSSGIGDLEQQPQQQPSCLKQTCETLNASPNHSTQRCTLHEMEEEDSNHEMVKPDFDNVSSSSTREITSVHEDITDSVKYESDCANSSTGVKVVPVDAYSSDDESFHSFGDSNSSIVRLSNASAGSLGDNTAETLSTNVSNREPCLAPDQSETQNQISIPALIAPSSSNCAKNFTIPPTPPPPPPPTIHFPPLNSSFSSTRITSKASCSSTLKNISPPRKSSSSCGSNQISEGGLPFSPQKSSTPSQTSSPIPPPPSPPPFLKVTNSSTKGPPPPPLPQLSPLGKDGTPLPKLKPLHWDKVRAAPDHSMVWDKLRSSSFE